MVIVCDTFPFFKLADSNLYWMIYFKYLSHIIGNKVCEDLDIDCRNKKVLWRKFRHIKVQPSGETAWACSDRAVYVSMTLPCDVILVVVYMQMKISCATMSIGRRFIAYRKYDSVTNVNLPSCDTIWHNDKVYFNSGLKSVGNSIVHNNCEF